jgi:hypothetical protein
MRLRSVAVLALVSGLFAAGLAVPALATAQQHTLTISAPAGAVVDFGDTASSRPVRSASRSGSAIGAA